MRACTENGLTADVTDIITIQYFNPYSLSLYFTDKHFSFRLDIFHSVTRRRLLDVLD